MLEFFPEEEEIQIHNSTLFACFSRLFSQPRKLSRNASCQNMTYTTRTETSTCEKEIHDHWNIQFLGGTKQTLIHCGCARKRPQFSWHCSHGQKAVYQALRIHSILGLKHSYTELDYRMWLGLIGTPHAYGMMLTSITADIFLIVQSLLGLFVYLLGQLYKWVTRGQF